MSDGISEYVEKPAAFGRTSNAQRPTPNAKLKKEPAQSLAVATVRQLLDHRVGAHHDASTWRGGYGQAEHEPLRQPRGPEALEGLACANRFTKTICAICGRKRSLPPLTGCRNLDSMSVREILEELPRLDASERQTVLRRLMEIDPALEVEESPEMLTAIDEAVRSFDLDKGVGIEEARSRVAQWTSK